MAKLLVTSRHAPRLKASRSSAQPYAEKTFLFWIWLISYVLLALTTIWLWEARGVISTDLLELQAQRRMIVEVTPANIAALVAAKHPLMVCLVLLAGSACNASALLGATTVTWLAHQVRAAGLPRGWTLMLIAQPTLFFALVQNPNLLLHALLIVSALSALYLYIERRETFYALTGALILSMDVVSEHMFWIMLLYLAVVLLATTTRSWREQLSVILIVLFPSLCIGLTWRMLQFSGQPEGQAALSDMSSQAWSSGLQPILVVMGVSVGMLLLAAYSLFKQRATTYYRRQQTWFALLLLLGAPCIDIYLHLATDGPFVALAIGIVAFPLYARPLDRFPFGQGIAGTVVVGALLLGWTTMLPAAGEPYQSLMRSFGQPIETPTMPYQRMAAALNERLQAGDRVLLDSAILAPLVPLIAEPQALLLPQQRLYVLAVQEPLRWARFVVIQDEQRTEYDLSGYRLLLRQDHFEVYERTTAPSTEISYRRSTV